MTETTAQSDIGTVPEDQHISLCEALDRVLNKGAVVAAEITISVADVDLVYLSLQALVTSVETGRRLQAQMQREMTNDQR
ncbi:gas vesicle protein [uncultured Thiohalocapsa sp.]|uniref:gas vesicle protein n=1 Tax=uncultured Thiohalocapsa sp. TaxID=768990 RepID=UPI0025FCB477|nr:gas vesicle protein [uncultured Thiohalocapsa sp.]